MTVQARRSLCGGLLLLALALATPAKAQVKFGVAGPFSGPNAAFGMQLKNGAEFAIADINASGGILGKTITTSIGDDVSDPREGVSIANKFASGGVSFVIGHFNSGTTIPASDVYRENNILVISPAATSPKLTDRGLWNVFRTCGRDDQQGAVAAEYILKNFRGKKIAIVQDKTTYGLGLAEETRHALIVGGITPVLYEGIVVGTKDFAALVAKIKAVGADLVYYGGTHVEAALILEANAAGRFDRLMVVTCHPEQRIVRYARRLGISEDAARAEVTRRMAAQIPDEEKIRAADFVIDNSESLASTEQQVQRVFAALRLQ